MSISETIRNRIIHINATTKIDDPIRFNANDNISAYINDGELELLEKEVAENFQSVLTSLVIDTDNDWNTKRTAERVAKMFVQEIFHGRFVERPRITDFPNVGYDQMYITGPIKIRSTCAHHFQNISGNCWIGLQPGDNVIGLSKFNRIVDWVASRPQIQEEMTEQIADEIEAVTDPIGLAVVIKAEHHCMTMRGVKEHENDMTTSVMRGEFRTAQMLRNEFLMLMNNMKGHGD